MPFPERHSWHLRLGRVSRPGGKYFVTLCTAGRVRVLDHPLAISSTVAAFATLQRDGDAEILAATVMPDHVHLIITLGARLKFGQVVGKLKTLARNRGTVPWHWQQDGFEHELRPTETIEDYAFYVFMNPYRARLISLEQRWHGWFCEDLTRFRFFAGIQPHQSIPAEWLEASVNLRAKLVLRR